MSNKWAYYNEIDEAACVALRQLIADGVICDGEVDNRSIKEVSSDDVRRFKQVHWFSGGGLWSVAARLAGWPDDEPIWTASCPCQPFSQAGQGRGIDDERHLWPDVDRLVREANVAGHGPRIIVGEQVAGKAGYDWFNGVRTDLAAQGYGAWVVDTPACAVDAPNIRQRLYWIAVANSQGEYRRVRPAEPIDRQITSNSHDTMVNAAGQRRGEGRPKPEFRSGRSTVASADAPSITECEYYSACSTPDDCALPGKCQRGPWRLRTEWEDIADGLGVTLGDAKQPRLERQPRHGDGATRRQIKDRPVAEADGGSEALGDTDRTRELQRGERSERLQPERGRRGMHTDGGDGEVDLANSDKSRPGEIESARSESSDTSIGAWRGQWNEFGNSNRPNGSFWSDHEWIICHDGKARRAKSGIRNVADGLPYGLAGQRDAGDDQMEKQIQSVTDPALLVPSFKGRTEVWKITGNAINPVLAAQVIGALIDALNIPRPFTTSMGGV